MKKREKTFWALVSSNGSIRYQNSNKYQLLKFLIVEPVSKKNINSFKSGDKVTINHQQRHTDRCHTYYTDNPQTYTLYLVKQTTEFIIHGQ